MSEDHIHQLRLHAICGADKWFDALEEQEQFYVYEIASRLMSQGAVQIYNGDRRRVLDQFPDA